MTTDRRWTLLWCAIAAMLAMYAMWQRRELKLAIAVINTQRMQQAYDSSVRPPMRVDPRVSDAALESAAADSPAAIKQASNPMLQRPPPIFRPTTVVELQRATERQYGSILQGLGLPEEELQQLRMLLVERRQALEDVREIMRDRHWGGGDTWKRAVDDAIAPIDREVEALVGPGKYSLIRDMLDSSFYLGILQSGYLLDAEFAGQGLSAEAKVRLASAMEHVMDTKYNPQASALMNQNIDPATGLDELDASILQSAARFLSPTQLDLLKSHLALRHKRSVP